MKAHGPAQAQREQALRQADFFAAGAATGQDTDGAVVFARFAQHEKIAARRAAADARRLATPGQRVGDSATRHGHVGIIVVQDGQGQGRAAPVRERLGQAARQCVGAEHAAVQQQGVGQLALLLVQKAGQVARDGSILRIRQAEFDDAGAGFSCYLAEFHLGEEAIDHQGRQFLARDVGGTAATDQA